MEDLGRGIPLGGVAGRRAGPYHEKTNNYTVSVYTLIHSFICFLFVYIHIHIYRTIMKICQEVCQL